MAKQRPKRINEVSAGDQRSTPQWLADELAQRYAGGFFDLDVAAAESTAKAPLYYTKVENGLKQPWGDVHRIWGLVLGIHPQPYSFVDRPSRVWLQPPWSDISPWVDKAIAEVAAGRCSVVVGLLPSRTGTEWYAKLDREAELIVPIRGRVNFPSPTLKTSSNPEDCLVTVIRPPLVVANIKPESERKKRSAA